MKSFSLLRVGLVTAAILTASSGCGSGGMHAAPLAEQSTTTLIVPQHEDFTGRLSVYQTKGRLLFQADESNGRPYIQIIRLRDLGRNRYPVATIVDGLCAVEGLTIDPGGTLYVANQCTGDGSISEYPLGQTTPSIVITNGLISPGPYGLAIGPSGTLYVTDAASVIEYAYGSSSPSKTITSPGFSNIRGLTVDNAGNIFIADAGVGAVWKLPHGTRNVENMGLRGLDTPDDVKFDPKGNLWVSDNGKTYVPGFVNVYPPGSVYPSQTITPLGYPSWMAIDSVGTAMISNTAGSASTVKAYKPGQYTPYAILTNGVIDPAGLVIKP
ncbi:MAG: hypothetical protein WCC84_04870 [Candidatus Cybelea sp.]